MFRILAQYGITRICDFKTIFCENGRIVIISKICEGVERESEVGILKNIDRVGLGFIERACGRSHGVNPVTSRRRDTQGWVRGHGRGEMFYIRLPVRGVGATAV
jgi:hypothetical protein